MFCFCEKRPNAGLFSEYPSLRVCSIRYREWGYIILPILFLLFWMILNGRVTVEVVAIGVFVSVIMSLFTYRVIGASLKKELMVWKKYGLYFVPYIANLISSVIKANFQMIRLILSPGAKISPQIVYFESPVKTDFAKILLTYSIMLTPGTFIFELEDGRFGVHAIEKNMTEGINDTNVVHKLKKLEGAVLKGDMDV